MRTRFIRVAVWVVSVLLILIGIVGLFLPFLQGILFIIIGLYLLSITSPKLKAWLDHRMVRFPRLKRHVDRQHARISKFLNIGQ